MLLITVKNYLYVSILTPKEESNFIKSNNILYYFMARPTLIEIAVVLVSMSIVFILPISITPTTTVATTAPNSSISFPLSTGYVNGKIAHFIATDASNNQTAASIADNLGYKVNYAPSLTLIPESARQQGYEFLNGIKGEGAFGFQLPVASALPEDKGYSPIVQLNFVEWKNNNATVRELKSAQEIIAAQSDGDLQIIKTNILINSPAVQQ